VATHDHATQGGGDAAADDVPRQVDLRAGLSPVRDQGPRYTCLAFTVTAAHEAARSAHLGRLDDLAVDVLYWGCKTIDGDHAPGSTFASAAVALVRWGQPAEDLWPYDSARDDTSAAYAPPPDALDPARCHRVRLRQITPRPLTIKGVLASGRVVMLGVRLSRGFFAPEGGRIPVPASAGELEDGHAVLVVGYDDGQNPDDGALLCRNSWGTDWGDGGHAYLPYAYIERYGGEAWVVDEEPVGADQTV